MSWGRVLDADTPATALSSIAGRLTDDTIADLRRQLESVPELTVEMRDAAIRKVEPQIRARTLSEIHTAWLDLQVEAGRVQ
jgi:hypothetical protein